MTIIMDGEWVGQLTLAQSHALKAVSRATKWIPTILFSILPELGVDLPRQHKAGNGPLTADSGPQNNIGKRTLVTQKRIF